MSMKETARIKVGKRSLNIRNIATNHISGEREFRCEVKKRYIEIAACVEAIASEEPATSVACSQAWMVGLVLLLVIMVSNQEVNLDEQEDNKRKVGPASTSGLLVVCMYSNGFCSLSTCACHVN